MANALFDSYRNLVLTTGLDLSSLSIKGIFVDHGTDTPNTSTDNFMDDITAGARNPTEANAPALASKTTGSVGVGVFDAADLAFTGSSVLTGSTSVESFILYEDSGTESTSDLLAYWDTATGLPLTPNGGDVTVVFNASGIWRF